MTDLVALGEPLGLFRADEVGPLRAGARGTFSFGGAESNVAIGMARLGHSTAMIGRVGDDSAGRVITGGLRAEGVDVSGLLVDQEAPTALMMRTRRTADRTTVEYYRRNSACSRMQESDLDEAVLQGARVLHVSGITLGISESARLAAEHAVRLVRQAGGTVSVDINYRSRVWSRQEAARALRGMVGHADILFGSQSELTLFTDQTEPDAMAAAVAELGPGEVVTKRGEQGALAWAGGQTTAVPAVAVTCVDPVGAGDAFVAGYLSARLAGASTADRLRRGALCGAFAVSVPGDWEGLPHLADLNMLNSEDNVNR